MRITWDDSETGEKKSYERHIYIHRNTSGE
jgi:hypothetical protein